MTALVTLDQPFSVKTRQRPLQMFLASNKDNDEVGPVFFLCGHSINFALLLFNEFCRSPLLRNCDGFSIFAAGLDYSESLK